MTLGQFTLVMMVLILIVQIASLLVLRAERKLRNKTLDLVNATNKTFELLNDTLKVQAITQHELIKRVRELERRINAERLPGAAYGAAARKTGME